MKKGFAIFAAAATISAGALAVPAAAQDNSTFTGLRVEGLMGYDAIKPGSAGPIENSADVDRKIDDVAYGVGIGYDVNLGGIVLGVEGEWMQSEASTDYNTAGFQGFGVGNVQAGRDLYVGARAGILATPSTLVYATGGYSNAKLGLLATDNTTEIGADVKLDGWRVGGGIEQAIDRNLFAKAEYRYSNYGRGQFEAPSGAASDRFDVDLDRHQVMLGVGYRF